MPHKNAEEHKAAKRSWYQRNKGKQKASNDARRLRRAEWFFNLKRTFKCERCPENHPACLEFHHLDPSTKEMGVTDMVAWGFSEKLILEEIAKCICLCSNCHQKHHWEERQKSGTARFVVAA